MQPITREELDRVYVSILTYYTGRVLKYGASPAGVDWSSTSAQELRFTQLLKLCDFSGRFVLNDIGCGYGALLGYLMKCHLATYVDYLGIDLSPQMIREAHRLWGRRNEAKFAVGAVGPRIAEYSVASGIFNVQLDETTAHWEQYIAYTLTSLRATSQRGFAVNFKVARSVGHPRRWGLYATTPQCWIQYCEHQLECSVELLTDYGLDEFTLLARAKLQR
jgi:SAM-dependent methyltransferase